MKLSLIVSLILTVSAAWPSTARCGWQTFNIRSGLADNNVYAITEDHSGNLWFGVYGGVSRFDGVSWKTYTAADGLASDFVYVDAITEDHSGNLWFGTVGTLGASLGNGASRFDGATWKTYTTADGLAGNFVYAITEDHSGNLWFGCYGGVSRFDGVSWKTYTTADGLAGYQVHAIKEDRMGNLWFGCYGGVSRFDGVNWKTYTTADGLSNDLVDEIAEGPSGDLWFVTRYGLSRFDGVAWSTYYTEHGIPAASLYAITEDRFGNLWVGGDGAVSRFDGVSWRTYTVADGLAGSYVSKIFADHSGNLWIEAIGAGVSRFDGTTWKSYTDLYALASIYNYVRTIATDRSGNLWVSTSGGVGRFDGTGWSTYYLLGSISGTGINAITEDRSGNLWFGGGGGVTRFDGVSWKTYTSADGLAYNYVNAITEDPSGNLWFGTPLGVSRFDGTHWKTYTTADGLGSDYVIAITADRSGNLWFGTTNTNEGVTRFDGTTWKTYTAADGVGGNAVSAIAEDRSGSLWFALGYSGRGVSRFDGTTWNTYTTAGNAVSSIAVDHSGNLWFGSQTDLYIKSGGGVSRFDGTSWGSYTIEDGLASDSLNAIAVDRSGSIWFGTGAGLTRYEPDRVPPQTVFLTHPPALSASRDHSATFVAAFGETKGIRFSSRFDGGPWSEWIPVGSWTQAGLADGTHTLEVRARDDIGNIDATPATAVFQVDGTPPAPVIASPSFGQAVHGSIAVVGTAADARFSKFQLELRPSGSASWFPPEATVLAESSAQVASGTLASWDTTPFPDGNYDLRVSVMDSLGLVGNTQVTVIVDNHAPYAEETTPARVPAASGGDVFTTNSEVHLYFPPHAFSDDAVVMIAPAPAASGPDTLPSGAVEVLSGYEFSWTGGALKKLAGLELSYAGSSPQGGTLALYSSPDGTTWTRLGGTVDAAAQRISLSITGPGRYALFSEPAVPIGDRSLTGLSFMPRIFSPTGGFADQQVRISFTLGRAAPVTVRVYSRSGRLVREVVTAKAMNAGANLVRWDGRDRNGGFAVDGLYLVTVEALGRTERKTLAVVK